jgi:hypothetical protein
MANRNVQTFLSLPLSFLLTAIGDEVLNLNIVLLLFLDAFFSLQALLVHDLMSEML